MRAIRLHRYNNRITIGDFTFDFFNTLLMIFVMIVSFYPFIYMTILSVSTGNTYARVLLYPIGFSLRAYVDVFTHVDFANAIFVSIARSTLGPICTLFIIYMGAYALSKPNLVFRKILSRYVVLAMYVTAGMLPAYINISQLKLMNSFWVYIIPALANVFELILIRTFIEGLPKELEESAVVDGANDLQIAFKIILPLCIPVIAAMGLFEFINQWNAYVDTLLFNTDSSSLFTIQYVLTNYIKMGQITSVSDLVGKSTSAGLSLESLRMAMTVMACIPIIIVYPFLQKYFIKGLLIGSIKG